MATPTNRWKGAPQTVTYTPTFPSSAAAVPFTGIKSGKYDEGISQKLESADSDGFATVVFNDYRNPTQSFETINTFVGFTLTPDQRGTLAYQVADAYNGLTATGGGKSLSMTNAFFMGRNIDLVYREFGKQSMSFGCISSDGTTHPVTVAAL